MLNWGLKRLSPNFARKSVKIANFHAKKITLKNYLSDFILQWLKSKIINDLVLSKLKQFIITIYCWE